MHAIVSQALKILQPEQEKQLQELAPVMVHAAVKEAVQKFATAIGGGTSQSARTDWVRLTPAASA